MKLWILLLFLSLLPGIVITAQVFSGVWKGTITRDFGDETVTDSLELELNQHAYKITGYSMLYVKPGKIIKCTLEGTYQPFNKTLRLTETGIDYTNLPNSPDEFFLDRYLLTYNNEEKLVLSGKSIPFEQKSIYSRSKIYLRKG